MDEPVWRASWQQHLKTLIPDPKFDLMDRDFRMPRNLMTDCDRFWDADGGPDRDWFFSFWNETIDCLVKDSQNNIVDDESVFFGIKLVTMWWRENREFLKEQSQELWPQKKKLVLSHSAKNHRNFSKWSKSRIFVRTPTASPNPTPPSTPTVTPPSSPRKSSVEPECLTPAHLPHPPITHQPLASIFHSPQSPSQLVAAPPSHVEPEQDSVAQVSLDEEQFNNLNSLPVLQQLNPHSSAKQDPEVLIVDSTSSSLSPASSPQISLHPIAAPLFSVEPELEHKLQEQMNHPDSEQLIHLVNPTSTSPNPTPSSKPHQRQRSMSAPDVFVSGPATCNPLLSAEQKPLLSESAAVFPCYLNGTVFYFGQQQFYCFIFQQWLDFVSQAQTFFSNAWKQIGALAPLPF